MAAYERVTLNRGGRNNRFDCNSSASRTNVSYHNDNLLSQEGEASFT